MPERAQTMEDRLVESAELGRLRIDVKRVVVTRQSIDVRLIRCDRDLGARVGCPLGHGYLFGVGGADPLEWLDVTQLRDPAAEGAIDHANAVVALGIRHHAFIFTETVTFAARMHTDET